MTLYIGAMSVGPMTPEERYSFDLQGFLVRRGVLGSQEIEALHAEIDAQAYPPPGDSIASQRFTGFVGTARALTNLMDHEAVLPVVREVNGQYARLDHSYGIHMKPGTAGLWVHGGANPFDPAQYYGVHQGRIHCGLIGVQWALVDHLSGGGGFCCIPGSHKGSFGRPESIDYGHPLIEEVELLAGDIVFFTEAITHGTLPWTAPYVRRSVFFKYSPGNSAYNLGRPVDSDRFGYLSPVQQRLCQLPSVAGHAAIEGD
jgi:ectoine hydroxylase-related dioxygenase (phytanoyl-CoA dioxygenase family)